MQGSVKSNSMEKARMMTVPDSCATMSNLTA